MNEVLKIENMESETFVQQNTLQTDNQNDRKFYLNTSAIYG